VSEDDKVRDYVIVTERGKDTRSLVAKHVVRRGYELLLLKPAEWNLEDIFLKIVTQEQEEALT